jgi:2-polyprenyl-6-methoxyphenol hydroxylase-like FAD-dependent oxidoreductase
MSGKAIVCGASIGGLFAAAALLRAGWDVSIHERSDIELAGRGAGIVTHDILIEALERVGVDVKLADLGVAVVDRVAFDKGGDRVATVAFPQIVTSWDRIHQMLRAIIPNDRHHLGKAVVRYSEDADGVTVFFADGTREQADVLIGADGFRSAIRAQMQPAIQPIYSGYVVWRALAHEQDLTPDILDTVFPAFGFYAPTNTQIIGYPIAGPGNDLRPGHRRYNFVWYSIASTEKLDDMLTDETGHRHLVSIPPPLIRQATLDQMQKEAEAMLPDIFVRILGKSERPFFTPIYDHHSPVMGHGRVALVGDAACVARPHVGMGVTKAACDALALAHHLSGSLPLPQAMAAYSQERAPAGLKAMERARTLGHYIFDPAVQGNEDGRANPRLDEIMRTTAVTV